MELGEGSKRSEGAGKGGGRRRAMMRASSRSKSRSRSRSRSKKSAGAGAGVGVGVGVLQYGGLWVSGCSGGMGAEGQSKPGWPVGDGGWVVWVRVRVCV